METIQPTLRVVTTPEFSSSTIASPLEGNVKELSTIEDEVFSSGMLGKGVAIEPDNGDVVSPVAGVVTTVFPTKHAIGLTSDDGVEILIHIGMDTGKSRSFKNKSGRFIYNYTCGYHKF